MVQVKGSTLAPRLKFIKEHDHEGDKFALVAARLDAEFQKEIKNGIMQNQWYPLDYFNQLTRAIDAVFGRGDLSLIPELGRYSAEAGLNTIYKVFIKVGSPEFIVQRAVRVWGQYYSSGELETEVLGQRRVKITLKNFETPSRELCLSVLGWMQKTLEMSAGKSGKVTENKCRLKGDTVCEFLAEWE